MANNDFLSRIRETVDRFKGSGLNDFHTRQKVLMIFMITAVIFMLFYWTGRIMTSRMDNMMAYTLGNQERIERVHELIVQVRDKDQNAKVLTTGLQSYIQGLGQAQELHGTISNIRLVSGSSGQEQVTFRAENLVYQEFTNILKELEQYDNVWIRSLTVAKRYDNPNRIDVTWDVIRSGS